MSSTECVDPRTASVDPDADRAALADRLAALAQAVGGVFRASTRIRPLTGEPAFTIRLLDCGWCSSRRGAAGRRVAVVPDRPRWVTSVGTSARDEEAIFLAHAEGLEQYQRASPELECLFFDATTDVGVFTVYALQIARHDSRVHTLVGCATAFDPAAAIAKVIRDLTHVRTAFREERPIPSDWDGFGDLLDGATFMARAEQARAFEFLTRSPRRRSLSRLIDRANGVTDQEKLDDVLGRLRRMGADVYAVDLTPDEAVRCGMIVVRAVIPTLQPLSLSYRARYLAHPRLYDGPRRMGH